MLFARQFRVFFKKKQKVTVIPGDGVYPELMNYVKDACQNAGANVDWHVVDASEIGGLQDQGANLEEVIDSCKKTKVCLKGIISSPHGNSARILQTLNMRIRQSLDLFANVVKVKSIKGFETRHNNVDVVIIREQTEGEYSALEHESVPGVVESLKIITRRNSERIARFAFDYAIRHNRKKVTAVHKANIMKLGDGLFLECCTKVAKLYPHIEFDNIIIDNCCMQLVSHPEQFDVMVMPNLYGNILDNLAAGLVGGAGMVAGESYSKHIAFFEPGARHAYAEAVGRNLANPTGMLLCAANMLNHIFMEKPSMVIQNAIEQVIKSGKVRTKDMGGYSTTQDFMTAIQKQIRIETKRAFN